MLFKETLTEFYAEVEGLLKEVGRLDLVEQLPRLELAGRCACGQNVCATFYVEGGRTLNEVEKSVIGVRHGDSIDLDPEQGWVVVDIDNHGRLTTFEVLNRDDVWAALRTLELRIRSQTK